jgi:hypothetical protein
LKEFYQAVSNIRTYHAGAEVYHTNVVMSIGSRHAIVCFDVISEGAAQVRDALAPKDVLVEISAAQMQAFCGNVLELSAADGQRFLVMSSRAHAAFGADALTRLEGIGLRIVHADLALLEWRRDTMCNCGAVLRHSVRRVPKIDSAAHKIAGHPVVAQFGLVRWASCVCLVLLRGVARDAFVLSRARVFRVLRVSAVHAAACYCQQRVHC